MKTTRKNKTRFFITAIGLAGLFIMGSCSKETVEAVDCATRGKNCDQFYDYEDDSKLSEEKLAADSTAVAKLPVRVETNGK